MSATTATSDAPLKGIAFMVLAMFLLITSDAFTKWLGGDYSAWQIISIRSIFVLLIVCLIVWRRGGIPTLKVRNAGGQAIRAGCYVMTTMLIAISMILLPLADAEAMLFASPLFITALAAPLLAERVGWRRWAAVPVGFTGMLVMLRPTPDAIQVLALIPLAAAAFSAVRDILSRKLSVTESTNSIMFWSSLTVVVVTAMVAPFVWRPLAWGDLGLMAIAGTLVGSAHYLMVEAYRAAEAALVSPFKYSGLIWAVIFGFVIWGDIPDLWIITGGALVVASGLYIVHRETMRC